MAHGLPYSIPEVYKRLDALENSSGEGLQIGTTATTAIAGNKVPTSTDRGGVLLQGAVANIGAQTIAGADAEAVITSANTAVNAVGTKLNSLLAALRAAGIIVP